MYVKLANSFKLAKGTVLYPAQDPKNLHVEQTTLNTNSNTLRILEFVFRVRETTFKFFGLRQSYETAKLVKRTVLYPALNPKNLDLEQLTLEC